MDTKTIIIAIITLLPISTVFVMIWQSTPTNIRLPTHIWPKAYNITIQPFMEAEFPDQLFKFSGDVHIRVQSVISTKRLIIHSKKLNYSLVEYWAENAPLLKTKVERMHFDINTERLLVELKHNMEPEHSYILHFKYTGSMNNDSYGIFWYKYDHSNYHPKWLVATQFQPNEARSAFPCFDEPQFKATFTIIIIRPKHMRAFSNRRRSCSYTKGNLTVDKFKTTPVMPTYLVAFLIAPFEERTDGNFSVLAKPEDFSLTKFSFDFGSEILTLLGSYLNLSYYELGIEKLTLVAMPNLNFRGMENWGLILMQRNLLLYNGNLTTSLEKQQIILTVAHEVSHMWFGNLVTCNWWNSLWLNEGFATYFSYFGLAMMHNNSDFWEELFHEEVIRFSLSIDVGSEISLSSDRKRVTRDYFTSIIYRKGASVIHMTKNIIGDKSFQNSIRKYLKVNKYQTVTSIKLQNILQEYWPVNFQHDLETFFKSFITQTGYPVITFYLKSNGSRLEVSQEPFMLQNNKPFPIYNVPISFTTNIQANFSHKAPIFFLSTKKVDFKLPSPAKWLIANIQAIGYYRVNYDTDTWLHIAKALQEPNWSGIPVLNRAQIVDDIEHLFCIGKVNSNLALKVLSYLRTESSYFPWKSALKYFWIIIRHSRMKYGEIANFVRDLSSRAYLHLGFIGKPSDNFSELYNREQIVPLACKYGNPACLHEVEYYFKERKKLHSLPYYLQFVVYCTMVRESNETVYKELFSLYLTRDKNVDEYITIRALGCLKEPHIVEKHFWNILTKIQSYDLKINALQSLYSESTFNALQIYELVKINYMKVKELLGNETVVAEIISEISKYFSEDYQKKDFIDFTRIGGKFKSKEALRLLESAISILNEDPKCF